jgi:putative ABC transport system permease protein
METLWQDLRYGIRMLVKSPGFTAVAVLTLALGIGANTAIFSVIYAVLLRPLPYRNPDRVVMVGETDLRRSITLSTASYPNFADLKSQNQVFDRIAAFHDGEFTLTNASAGPEHVHGEIVSGDLLLLLGVAPALGQYAFPDDASGEPAREHGVVLSHSLWQRRFGSDQNVLGQIIKLDDKAYTVLGMMPPDFQFPIQAQPVDLWISTAIDAETTDPSSPPMTAQRGAHFLSMIARLKPGVTVAQAQANADTIASALQKQYPDQNAHRGFRVVPALQQVAGDSRPALLILFGAVGCVLLIASANVANLLLARATTRHKEMAIRAALGADRARVIRQLLTESALLSLFGGALGLLLAVWVGGVLIRLTPEDIPRLNEASLNGWVLGFAAVVSLLVGIVFGLVPAFYSSRSRLYESLKEGGRASTDGQHRNHARSALVVLQVGLAVVLLTAAGLLIQSLSRLWATSPGFDPSRVLTMTVGLPDVRYSTDKQVEFFGQLVERLKALPGVRNASAVFPLPLSGDYIVISFEIEGRPMAKSEEPVSAVEVVETGYFRTMGIPLIKGRDFRAQDDLKSPGVVIINETLARRIFPNEDPVGKHVKYGISTTTEKARMREIIGVVGDTKPRRLSADLEMQAYLPQAQVPFDFLTLVIRAQGDPHSIFGAARGEVAALDKDLPVFSINTMDHYLAASVAQSRFNAILLAVFAGIALVLTAVGLFGVMAYIVTQRTHEIGVRMALGAQPSHILKTVLAHGTALTLTGIVTGLVSAAALTRLMANLLFGVSARDPLTYVGVAVFLAAVALFACYLPARRAMRVDPMVALRYE